jgi:hypothetical protein
MGIKPYHQVEMAVAEPSELFNEHQNLMLLKISNT